MTLPVVQCASCKHFDRENRRSNTCSAFPNGIPLPIIQGDHDHRESFPGDNGIRFEPKE